MKVFLSKIKFIDIITAIILSSAVSILIYKVFYPYCVINNLKDFYIGKTVFENHNKLLDFIIYFVYLGLFCAVLPFITEKRLKYFSSYDNIVQLIAQKSVLYCKNILNSIKISPKFIDILKKFQIFAALGFILLYPFDGGFYPKLILIISFLIAISVYDVFFVHRKRFSPFCLAAFLFIIFFKSYYPLEIPIDDHHLGESFTTFLMHDKFHFQYYKDIMLMHGLSDVIPSMLGKYLFHSTNVYGFTLGKVFFENIKFLAIITSILYIFKSNILFTAPFLMSNLNFPHVRNACLYLCAFLVLIKRKILRNPFLGLVLYIIFSFLLFVYWTSFGIFWIISSLPFAIFLFLNLIFERYIEKVSPDSSAATERRKMRPAPDYIQHKFEKFQSKSLNFKLSLLFLVCLFFMLLFVNKDFIFNFFIYFLEYAKGYSYAFGDSFGKLSFDKIHKLFALLIVPILLIEVLKILTRANKSVKIKDINFLLFSLFALIFPIISVSYSLGRFDINLYARCKFLSIAYIAILIPYFLYRKYPWFVNNIFKIILLMLFISKLLIGLQKLPSKLSYIAYEKIPDQTNLYNVGTIDFYMDQKFRLESIKQFIEENSSKDEIYLDLTNRGINYLYFDKKVPVQFVSYYNSITTKQDKESLEKLKANPPKVILIASKILYYDDIPVSIRINSQYRWFLTSGLYKIETYGGNVFLVKTEKAQEFSQDDLFLADVILSSEDLRFLPEAWANSVNKLPLEELAQEFKVEYSNPFELKIVFDYPISGQDIDFVYFSFKFSGKVFSNSYNMSINDSSSVLNFSSKNGKMLLPLDNFASWLLNKNIKEITIKLAPDQINNFTQLKNVEIKFFKRTDR